MKAQRVNIEITKLIQQDKRIKIHKITNPLTVTNGNILSKHAMFSLVVTDIGLTLSN